MKTLVALITLLFLITPALAQTKATNSAAESSHTFCTGTCALYGGQINNTNAASRWIMVFDSNTVPGDGAVVGCTTSGTARPCIIKWFQVAANSTLGFSDIFGFNGSNRLNVSQGLVAVCSSTGPFTKTATSDCVFSFEVTSIP